LFTAAFTKKKSHLKKSTAEDKNFGGIGSRSRCLARKEEGEKKPNPTGFVWQMWEEGGKAKMEGAPKRAEVAEARLRGEGGGGLEGGKKYSLD